MAHSETVGFETQGFERAGATETQPYRLKDGDEAPAFLRGYEKALVAGPPRKRWNVRRNGEVYLKKFDDRQVRHAVERTDKAFLGLSRIKNGVGSSLDLPSGTGREFDLYTREVTVFVEGRGNVDLALGVADPAVHKGAGHAGWKPHFAHRRASATRGPR